MDPLVVEAMQPYFSEKFFNPSSPYAAGVAVKRDYQAAKARIAQVLGVVADELVMTARRSQSIWRFRRRSRQRAVATIEHASVLSVARPPPRTGVDPARSERILLQKQ